MIGGLRQEVAVAARRWPIRLSGARITPWPATVAVFAGGLVLLQPLRNGAWTYYNWDVLTLVYDSLRVTQGQVPYRDFFEFVGPGVLWTQGLWMAIWGPSVSALEVLLITVLAGLGAALYVLSVRLTGHLLASLFAPAFLLLALVPRWPWPYHHWYGVALVVVTLMAVGAWLRSGRAGWLVAAGAGCMLAGLFTQTYGASLAVAIALFLVLRGPWSSAIAAVGWLGLGLVVLAAPVAAYFAVQGVLTTFVYDTTLFPATHYVLINDFPFAGDFGDWALASAGPGAGGLNGRLYTNFSFAAALGTLALPLAGVAASAIVVATSAWARIRGRTDERGAARELLLVCALATLVLFLAMLRVRKDMFHIAWATIVSYPTLLGFIAQYGMRLSRWLAAAVLVGVTMAAGAWFVAGVHSVHTVSDIDTVAARDPMVAYVRAHTVPGDTIAVIGWGAGEMYFFGRPPVLTNTVVIPYGDYTSAEQLAQVRREIEARHPRLVVFEASLSCAAPQSPDPRCAVSPPADYRDIDRFVEWDQTWVVYSHP